MTELAEITPTACGYGRPPSSLLHRVPLYTPDGTKSSTQRSLRGEYPHKLCKKGKIMKRTISIVSTLCVLAVVPAYAASDMMVPKDLGHGDGLVQTNRLQLTEFNGRKS